MLNVSDHKLGVSAPGVNSIDRRIIYSPTKVGLATMMNDRIILNNMMLPRNH
jgi:hypothetical protein